MINQYGFLLDSPNIRSQLGNLYQEKTIRENKEKMGAGLHSHPPYYQRAEYGGAVCSSEPFNISYPVPTRQDFMDDFHGGVNDFYCGISKKPNKRLGTMAECIDANKVGLYGLKKIDPIALYRQKPKISKNNEKLKIEAMGLRGKLRSLDKDKARTKTKKERQKIEEKMQEVEKQIKKLNREILGVKSKNVKKRKQYAIDKFKPVKIKVRKFKDIASEYSKIKNNKEGKKTIKEFIEQLEDENRKTKKRIKYLIDNDIDAEEEDISHHEKVISENKKIIKHYEKKLKGLK